MSSPKRVERPPSLKRDTVSTLNAQPRLLPNDDFERGTDGSYSYTLAGQTHLLARTSASIAVPFPSVGGVRIAYLGSKAAQADWIAGYIASVSGPGAVVADLFSGTGSVSVKLKALGLTVIANDHLTWAYHAARAMLLNEGPPTFWRLGVPLDAFDYDNYDAVLRVLNQIPPIDGFIGREYSPSGSPGRRYLTPQNAGRISAIRQQLHVWERWLTDAEFSLLITDLITSASAVSNTAGTYGSFLKNWKESALSSLRLRRSLITSGAPNAMHRVYSSDANQLVRELKVSAVYADPPYTKRQYAAYYHLLETIAIGDEPSLFGATGLRPWEHLSSLYCYRKHAASALEDLICNSDCEHFFLSYSDDGQIPHTKILHILGSYGSVATRESLTRRFQSSEAKREFPKVIERFYHVDRNGRRGEHRCL